MMMKNVASKTNLALLKEYLQIAISSNLSLVCRLFVLQLQDQQVAFYDYSHAFLGDQLSPPYYKQMVIGTKKQNPYDKIK